MSGKIVFEEKIIEELRNGKIMSEWKSKMIKRYSICIFKKDF